MYRMPCGSGYMAGNRGKGADQGRKGRLVPQGTIVTVPCAEEDFARETRKGSKLAPDLATVTWSAKTQMGRPSRGRRNARRASTSMPLGPEGGIRHTGKLAREARQGKAFEGGARQPTGPA